MSTRRSIVLATPANAWMIGLALAALGLGGCARGADAAPAAADAGKPLGKVEFPATTSSGEARERFVEGVLYLHNFEYDEAKTAFAAARELDPGFVLAYWGEAMTHNHPIWMRQDKDAALAVLDALAPTAEERLARAATPRERAWLHAVEALYGNTPESAGKTKQERDFLYRDEMARLHAAYSEDGEAATFYALSILGTAHQGRDFTTYMRAAAVAESVWTVNEQHPGAAHYLIHSYDDPVHAPLGLPMARAYAKIAPAAAHAQHMTSHIFVALGLWDDVASANEVATDVENRSRTEQGKPEALCAHYPFWLEYGYLQLGRLSDAAAVLDRCHQRVGEGPESGDVWHFNMMRARYAIDAEDWSTHERWATAAERSDLNGHFTDAFAAVRRGDLAAARRHLTEVKPSDDRRRPGADDAVAILRGEIEGLLAIAGGSVDRGLELLRAASEREGTLPYAFGPPEIAKPSAELLAEELARAGRAEEAVEAYRTQLERTPRRALALLGLARALERAGDARGAGEAYADLAEVWRAAEAGVPGLQEVRQKAAGAAASASAGQ
jgi:tetratricopeptide (TPR) repeat protein